MAILGLDFGERRVGLAISSGLMAGAYRTLEINLQHPEPFFESLKNIILEQKVDRLVVGLPLDSKGRETKQSRQIKKWGLKLENRFNLPVNYVEESFSTAQAMQNLGKIKKPAETRLIDAEAARIILEQYLNETRS